MRAPFRSVAVPCSLLVLSVFVASLPAQQPAGKSSIRPIPPQTTAPKPGPASKSGPVTPAGGQANVRPQVQADLGKQPRVDGSIGPRGEPPAIEEPVSEELQKILVEWEKKSALIKSLRGKHTRVVYNTVFEVEQLAEGKFYLQTPDKGRIDLIGKTPKKDEVSRRIGASGKRFRLEADQPQKWICDGLEIKVINEEEKSYEANDLPKHLRGTNIVNGPLPFLFGMKAEETKRRYKLKLLTTKNPNVHTLWVEPRLRNDADNYKEAYIQLDKSSFLPTAVKLVDPAGNLETVYTFTILGVNDVNNANFLVRIGKELFNEDADPFNPNLKKYKRVIPPQTTEANVIPTGGGTNRPGTTNTPRSTDSGRPATNSQQATRPGTSSIGPTRK